MLLSRQCVTDFVSGYKSLIRPPEGKRISRMCGSEQRWEAGCLPSGEGLSILIWFEESRVVSHDQVRIDLLHQIEADGDDDQKSGSPVEAGDQEGDSQRLSDDGRDDGDDGEEACTDISDAHHDLLEISSGACSWSVAWDEATVVFEVFSHVLRVEGDRCPEVTEEVDQADEAEVVDQSAVAEGSGKTSEEGDVREAVIEEGEEEVGDHQQAGGEDDRHDARLVDAEREELAVATHHASASDVLCGLNRNLTLSLRDRDDADDDRDEEDGEKEEAVNPGLSSEADALLEGGADQFVTCGWHLGENTSHDEKADSVADSELVNLLAEPHQEDGSCCHDEGTEDEVELRVVILKQ